MLFRSDQFYPEAAVLQAVILFFNCRFSEVRTAIEEFEYVYAPVREQLDSLLDSLVTNAEYYEFLVDAEARAGRRMEPRLLQIVNAAITDRSVRNALTFIDELDGELRMLERADVGWANSDLGQHVVAQLQQSRERAVGYAGQLVRNRMVSIRDDLGSKQRDATAILVETDLAEAAAGSSRLRDEMVRGGTDADTGVRVDQEQMLWTFEGEYWRDELGYYLYHIDSACR